jgi:hypothetical protein
VLFSNFGFQGALASIELYITPLCSQSPKRNLLENSKKAPKGIDKMRIRFIMELWGKVGKKGKR